MSKRRKRRDPSKEAVSCQVLQMARTDAEERVVHICPIYRPKTQKEPELIGTGFFLAFGERKFLLTAAHVFGPAGEGYQELWIPNPRTGNLTELVGTYARSKPNGGSTENDQNDVGIVLLAQRLAEQIEPESFITSSFLDCDDMGDFRYPYVAMGFPWRKSPRICRRSRVASATPCSYASELLRDEHLKSLGLDSRSHLFLRYDKRHSRSEYRRDLTAPDPHGMSGGPLWRLEPGSGHATRSLLVGIIIEWRKPPGGLLAVRLPIALAGIAKLCPEIANQIPQTQTLPIDITSPPLAP